eukprot:7533015-Lingulodinium_polyedra.AAC.1
MKGRLRRPFPQRAAVISAWPRLTRWDAENAWGPGAIPVLPLELGDDLVEAALAPRWAGART